MKNLENFSKETAKDLGVEDKITLAANRFYWKALADSMVRLEYNSYYVRGIGNFDISKYKLYNDIKRTIKAIRIIRISEKYTEEKREQVLQGVYKKLNLLLKRETKSLKFMGRLKEYWEMLKQGMKNPEQVLEGAVNSVKEKYGFLPEDEQEEIIRRKLICETCPYMSRNMIEKGLLKTDRVDEFCTMCSCPIITKTAALSTNCGIQRYNERNPANPLPLNGKLIVNKYVTF